MNGIQRGVTLSVKSDILYQQLIVFLSKKYRDTQFVYSDVIADAECPTSNTDTLKYLRHMVNDNLIAKRGYRMATVKRYSNRSILYAVTDAGHTLAQYLSEVADDE